VVASFSALCFDCGGWLWRGLLFIVEMKGRKKKTKNTSLFVHGFFFFVDTFKSVAGTGYIFLGCKKNKT